MAMDEKTSSELVSDSAEDYDEHYHGGNVDWTRAANKGRVTVR